MILNENKWNDRDILSSIFIFLLDEINVPPTILNDAYFLLFMRLLLL